MRTVPKIVAISRGEITELETATRYYHNLNMDNVIIESSMLPRQLTISFRRNVIRLG